MANHLGEATITLSLADGSKSVTCKIQVVQENDGTNNLNAKPYDAKEIRLSWTSSSAVSCYQIYRSTSKDGMFDLISTQYDPSTNSYTDKSSDLKQGTVYYYKVLFCYKSGYVFTKQERVLLRHTIDEYSFSFGNNTDTFGELTSIENSVLAYTDFAEVLNKCIDKDEKGKNYRTFFDGHCYGMVALAGMLNCAKKEKEGGLLETVHNILDFDINDFNIGAKKNADLSYRDRNGLGLRVKDVIDVLHSNQYYDGILLDKTNNQYNDKLYEDIKMLNEKNEPLILGMGQDRYDVENNVWEDAGHAVLAYGFEKVSSEKALVYIYDPNYPQEEKYIELKLNNDKVVGYKYGLYSDSDNLIGENININNHLIYAKIGTAVFVYKELSMLGKFYNLRRLCIDKGQFAVVNSKKIYTMNYQHNDDIMTIDYNETDKNFKFECNSCPEGKSIKTTSYTVDLSSIHCIKFSSSENGKFSVTGNFYLQGQYPDFNYKMNYDGGNDSISDGIKENVRKNINDMTWSFRAHMFNEYFWYEKYWNDYDLGYFGDYGYKYFMTALR